MRTLALAAMLAGAPVCVLADGTVSPPNPVGEKVYHAHLLPGVLPVAIIVCAFLLAALAACVLRRRAGKAAPDRH
jgi:hypothetical protein